MAEVVTENNQQEDLEVSIDIESLSVPSNVPHERNLVMVLAIGATFFNPNKIDTFHKLVGGSTDREHLPPMHEPIDDTFAFYSPVSLHQSLLNGFHIEQSTLAFWEKNSRNEHSYNMLAHAAAHTEDITLTLERFIKFLKRFKVRRVWARSPVFDCVILREAMNKMGLTSPINAFHERDVRTVTDMADIDIRVLPEGSMKHHALHDAATEAMHIQHYNRVKRETTERLAKLEVIEQLAAAGALKLPEIKLVDGAWSVTPKSKPAPKRKAEPAEVVAPPSPRIRPLPSTGKKKVASRTALNSGIQAQNAGLSADLAVAASGVVTPPEDKKD